MKPNWILTFSQEFDGPAGQAPDPKVWARDLGGGGFGNAELQSYTDGNANAFLDGKGCLVIEARKERTVGKDGIAREYSSARLKTQGTFAQRYGRFEARIRMPRGKGIWPAFWMLGESISKVGWPACGEIDVMEFLGHDPKTVYGTLHGPGFSGSDGLQGRTASQTPLDEDFHVYGVEWSPAEIRWTFDGRTYHRATPNDVGGAKWPFDQPFFLILNLAVGGHWPGYPDATTKFPQRLVVDWVRVYRDASLKVDDKAIQEAHRRRVENYREPLAGGPHKVPGDVPAADYRPGGYLDSDPQNVGGAYRPNDGVDIGRSGLAKPKYSVGWTKAGEWLEYDLVVPEDGRYHLALEAASEGPGGEFRFEIDGKPVTKATRIADTGGWTRWKVFDAGAVRLKKGIRRLRLALIKGSGETQTVGNLLQIKVSAVP